MGMTVEEFWSILKTTGRYETSPSHRRPRLDRMLSGCSPWVHLRIYLCVYRLYRAIRRGEPLHETWPLNQLGVLTVVEDSGGRVIIEGYEHLADLRGPVVLVANHMSAIETFFLPLLLLPHSDVTVVIKESLLRYPVLGPVLRAVGAVAVTRNNPRQDFRQVMEGGGACLRGGRSVVVFPQATRSLQFDPAAFSSLGAKLAQREGVPLLPLALKTDFLQPGRLVKDFGKVIPANTVHFKFGPPIDPATASRAAHQRAADFIAASLRSWGVGVAREPGEDEALRENGEAGRRD